MKTEQTQIKTSELDELWNWLNRLKEYPVVEKIKNCALIGDEISSFILDRAYALLGNKLGISVCKEIVSLSMKPENAPCFNSIKRKEEANYMEQLVEESCASLCYKDYLTESSAWIYDEISLNVTYKEVYKDGVLKGWAKPGFEKNEREQISIIERYIENHAIDFLDDNLFPLEGNMDDFKSFLVTYPDAIILLSTNLTDVDSEGIYNNGYLFRSKTWYVMKELMQSKIGSAADRKRVREFWMFGKNITDRCVGCIDYMHDVENGVFLFIHNDDNCAPKLLMDPFVILYFVYGDKLTQYLQEKYALKKEEE